MFHRLDLHASVSCCVFYVKLLTNVVILRYFPDVVPLQGRLDNLQKRVSGTKIFGSAISKDLRSTMLEYIKEIQSKVRIDI